MKLPPIALALALAGCAAAPRSPEAPAAEAAAVEASIPRHWIGTFTMVEIDNVSAGPNQFQLRLGLEAPNHFRAQRGCYTQHELERRAGRWEVTGDTVEWIS
jgi:hypothetical protein